MTGECVGWQHCRSQAHNHLNMQTKQTGMQFEHHFHNIIIQTTAVENARNEWLQSALAAVRQRVRTRHIHRVKHCTPHLLEIRMRALAECLQRKYLVQIVEHFDGQLEPVVHILFTQRWNLSIAQRQIARDGAVLYFMFSSNHKESPYIRVEKQFLLQQLCVLIYERSIHIAFQMVLQQCSYNKSISRAHP